MTSPEGSVSFRGSANHLGMRQAAIGGSSHSASLSPVSLTPHVAANMLLNFPGAVVGGHSLNFATKRARIARRKVKLVNVPLRLFDAIAGRRAAMIL
jgi:hypothetical protein